MGMPWNGKVCSGSLSPPPAVRVFVHVHLEVCFHFGWVSKEIAPSRRINIIGRGWGDCTSHELKVIGKEFHRVSAKCNGRSFFFFFRKIEKFFWKICFSLDVYLPETCNRRLWKDFLKLRNRASICDLIAAIDHDWKELKKGRREGSEPNEFLDSCAKSGKKKRGKIPRLWTRFQYMGTNNRAHHGPRKWQHKCNPCSCCQRK